MTEAAPGPLPETFRIAVVGAGIAGLACARQLHARGAKVTVFEQQRRPGGRAGTQQAAVGPFDHGASYFTVHKQAFEKIVAEWQQARAIERWHGRIVSVDGDAVEEQTDSMARFVGIDGMQSVARYLAQGLDIHLDTRIDVVARRGASWIVSDESGRSPAPGGFDAIVIALPAPAAVALLAEAPALARRAATVVYDPMWVALLALQAGSGFDFAGALVKDNETLTWATRAVDSKGQRPGPERWVLHATTRWTRLHMNMHGEDAASMLTQAFAERFNFGFRPQFLAGHRWLHARPTNPLAELFLWDAERRIGAVGDWCGGARIEDAYLSGHALSEVVAR